MATVTIFHISDLHLFVDEQGVHGSVPEIGARARISLACAKRATSRLRRLGVPAKFFATNPGPDEYAIRGMAAHNGEALDSLEVDLPALVEEELATSDCVVVACTGDIENFGRTGRNAAPYPGIDHLQTSIADVVQASGAHFIAVHGNHDLWPGVWPGLADIGELKVNATRLANHPLLANWQPDVTEVAANGHSVAVSRVNTVSTNRLAAVFAKGSLDAHPPQRPREVEALLATIGSAFSAGAGTIGIAVTHHPVHNFAPTNFVHATASGGLRSRDQLAAALKDCNVVLAGHRHRVDPPNPVTTSQLPLDQTVIQLAAGSTLQEAEGNFSDESYSFNRYRLSTSEEEGTETFAISRTVFRHSDTQGIRDGGSFVESDPGEVVLADRIPL
ncbi:MAG: metallophosphoesterase [Actinomycetota bacterium]